MELQGFGAEECKIGQIGLRNVPRDEDPSGPRVCLVDFGESCITPLFSLAAPRSWPNLHDVINARTRCAALGKIGREEQPGAGTVTLANLRCMATSSFQFNWRVTLWRWSGPNGTNKSTDCWTATKSCRLASVRHCNPHFIRSIMPAATTPWSGDDVQDTP